jgi:hypothetical protein
MTFAEFSRHEFGILFENPEGGLIVKPQKKISPKRNEIIHRMGDAIRGGNAQIDRFAVHLKESTKCGVCSRDGRTMVELSYNDGHEDYLGKTCARYVMDYVNSDTLT